MFGMRKLTIGLLGLAGAALTACSSHHSTAPTTAPATVKASPVAATWPAAPATVSGYRAAFAALPAAQWMGGDVGVTVPLGSAHGQVRTAWLFGDTMSRYRFVHSSAIVQTGGRFHVSMGGAQLLPNDDSRHIYWLEAGRSVRSGVLLLRARMITITDPANPWGFKDTGLVRNAVVTVSAYGDLKFVRWGQPYAEANRPGPMLLCPGQTTLYSGGHLCYSRHAHPELKLANGRTLVTTAQNWTDGTAHHRLADGTVNWRDWSLLFSQA
jgi:hypothetical protein